MIGLKIITIFTFFVGVLTLFMSILYSFSNQAGLIILFTMLISALYWIMAVGLLKRLNWARIMMIIVYIIGIGEISYFFIFQKEFLLIQIISFASKILISLLIILYLMRKKVGLEFKNTKKDKSI
jgi:hypothetical protein